MRPTCLFADKNFSTETNLQRCRCPVLMQDFLRTTNILCFSFNQIVNQFSESWINHLFTFHSSLRISSVLLSRLVTNPGFQSNFPFWDNGSPSYKDQSRYRPGQLFWNRNHNDDMQPFAHNFLPSVTEWRQVWCPFGMFSLGSVNSRLHNQVPAALRLFNPLQLPLHRQSQLKRNQ